MAGRFASVMFDFEAQDEVHLSVKEGQRVTVVEAFDDGWTRVKDQYGQEGLIPRDYYALRNPLVGGRSLMPGISDEDLKSPSSAASRSMTLQPRRSSPAKEPDMVPRKQLENLEQTCQLLQHRSDRLQESLDLRGREVEHLKDELERQDRTAGNGGGEPGVSMDEVADLKAENRKQQSQLLRLEEEVDIRNKEMDRVREELAAKDDIIEAMQSTLVEKTEEADELVLEARDLATRTEQMLKGQLVEKDKQLDILQGLLDELTQEGELKYSVSAPAVEGSPGKAKSASDRAFMDDFLLTVLQQKDELTDKIHDISTQLIETKARLGQTEFEKERLVTQLRNEKRKSLDTLSPQKLSNSLTKYGAAYTSVAESASLELAALSRERTELLHNNQELDTALATANERISMMETELNAKAGEKVTSKDFMQRSLSLKRTAEAEAQVADLQERIANLESQLATAESSGKSSPTKKKRGAAAAAAAPAKSPVKSSSASDKEVKQLKLEIKEHKQTIQQLQQLLVAAEQKVVKQGETDDQMEGVQQQLRHKDSTISQLTDQINYKDENLQQAQKEAKELRSKLSEQMQTIQSLRDQIDSMGKETEAMLCEKSKMMNLRTDMLAMEGKVAQAQLELAEAERTAKGMTSRFNLELSKRRALHNVLMEICGNIRVHCRLRPILPHDRKANDTEPRIKALDRMEVEIDNVAKDHRRKFEYDRIYRPEEDNEGVFREVRPIITSLVDGYNVCIMAYGQTGSGKTFTMLGPTDSSGIPSMTGIIPQSVRELFRVLEEKEGEASFKVTVSVLEVYNDTIIDLLSESRTKKHEVTEGSGMAEVPTVSTVDVSQPHDVLELVGKGMNNRVERKTDMNTHSSRSHLIVTIALSKKPLDGRSATLSRLYLVDLAGSECSKTSGATGVGLKEAKNINRSLSSLSDVLLALGKKKSNTSQHIPYRNSRLTHLLKDAIGGDAKMLLLLCVSPMERFLTESMQTLRFGNRARLVQKGPAQRKTVNAHGRAVKSGSDDVRSMAAAALSEFRDDDEESEIASPSKSKASDGASQSKSKARASSGSGGKKKT